MFSVKDGEGNLLEHFQLIQVDDKILNEQQELFSLLFLGSSKTILPQQMYELQHGELEKMTLFIVPVGQNDQGVKYEVVFNRLVQN